MIEYTVKVNSVGTKAWWINGKRHCEDGPAYVGADGTKEWYLNGQIHREDGPALEWADGTKAWYINGKYLTEKQFNYLYDTINVVIKNVPKNFTTNPQPLTQITSTVKTIPEISKWGYRQFFLNET